MRHEQLSAVELHLAALEGAHVGLGAGVSSFVVVEVGPGSESHLAVLMSASEWPLTSVNSLVVLQVVFVDRLVSTSLLSLGINIVASD